MADDGRGVVSEDASASVRAAIQDLFDGNGGILHIAHPDAAGAAFAAGSDRTCAVLRIVADRDSSAFALGPLISALSAHRPGAEIPLLPSGQDSPTTRWLSARLCAHLAELSARIPTIIVASADDPEVNALLELQASQTSRSPILWLMADTGLDHPESVSARKLAYAEQLVVGVLAAADIALTVPEIASLVGREERETASTLEALRSTGVVASLRGQWVARRPVELAGALPNAVRHGLRRAVLDIGIMRGAAPVTLAEMALDSARPAGDLPAARALADATGALEHMNPTRAVEYGLAALELFGAVGDERTPLAEKLLPLLWRLGRTEEARLLATTVFSEHGDTEVQARVLFWLAQLSKSAHESLRYTQLGLAMPGVSREARLRLLSIHVRGLTVLGRGEEVAQFLPSVRAAAHGSTDGESLSRLLTAESARLHYSGRFKGAEEAARAAERHWRSSRNALPRPFPESVWEPQLEAILGRPLAAVERFGQLIAENADAPSAVSRHLHVQRSYALLAAGRLDAAADELTLADTYPVSHDDVSNDSLLVGDRILDLALSVRVKLALHRGTAGELVALSSLLAGASPIVGSESWARVMYWRYLVDDARSIVSRIAPADLASLRWQDPFDEILFARVLGTRGEYARMKDLAVAARDRVERAERHPLALAVAAHLDGLSGSDLGAFDEAIAAWQELDRPLAAAAAQADLGSRLLKGDPGRGVPLLVQAHSALRLMGAQRDALRVRWHAHINGYDLGDGENRGVADVLTPAEYRVVEIALTGVSASAIATALGISTHTVTAHLRHVYTKLGIASRTELTSWARRVGLSF